MNVGDWVAIIVGAITVYYLRQGKTLSKEQNEIFREQNEIFAAQALGKPIPAAKVATNRWLIYRPVIAMLTIALLIWASLAYDSYDRHARSTQWRPWWIALLVDIGLVFAYSIYTHRNVLAFEKQRRLERSQLVADFVGAIDKLTPVIHWAYWRTKNINGLLVTEVLQRRLKDGLVLKATNAFLDVTPNTDPAIGENKHLLIDYSYGEKAHVTIRRWENTEFVLPVDPWLEQQLQQAEKEWSKPMPWTGVFKIQRMRADRVVTDPGITFTNKLRFNMTNITGKEIYVWMPLWESSRVPSLVDPTGSRFLLERSEGSWERKEFVQYIDHSVKPERVRNQEQCCVKLAPNFTFESYMGLDPNPQDSVEGLLKRYGTIGSILFPVKIDGKMYEIRVPASEV